MSIETKNYFLLQGKKNTEELQKQLTDCEKKRDELNSSMFINNHYNSFIVLDSKAPMLYWNIL